MKPDIVSLGSRSIPVVEPETLIDVLSAASDVVLLVSKNGEVTNVTVDSGNDYSAHFQPWVGKSLRQFLTSESMAKFDALLARTAKGVCNDAAVELNHTDDTNWQHPVRYTIHPVGREGDFLMLGTDLSPVAETQQQLVQAQIAIERGYEERREYDVRYRQLLNQTRDPFVFVTVNDGRIRDLNGIAANLLGEPRETLIDQPFSQQFTSRHHTEFMEELIGLTLAETRAEVTFQAFKTGRNVVLSPTIFRAAGERLILCRIDGLGDPAYRHEERLMSNLSGMYQNISDGIAFTDAKGLIEHVNEAFLEMVEAPMRDELIGTSISEFFARGQIDMNVMLDNAMRSKKVRSYSTKLNSRFGARTSVEIAVAYLNDRSRPSMAFTLRDVGRTEALRTTSPPSMVKVKEKQNVVDLVGSATLKEIVSETNEVIEKLCIEAAVEMTKNNRAAAAEMLGLSRQSLYVKLRKYGLLDRNSDG